MAYITDTGWLELEPRTMTKLLVETNHDADVLLNSQINKRLKERIAKNHLSISQVVGELKEVELPRLKEIWLMHISRRHGDGEKFKRQVEAVVPESVKVHLAI